MVAIVALALAAGYMFWLRDSSLVAVDNVDVVGVTSGDRGEIVAALTHAAESRRRCTPDAAGDRGGGAGFPTVDSVSVDPNFPHGMRIEVTERPPALLVEAGGEQVPAAADGTLLRGSRSPTTSTCRCSRSRRARRRRGGSTASRSQQALVLGAAPAPLRPLIEKVRHSTTTTGSR